jgi:hypothetical protein
MSSVSETNSADSLSERRGYCSPNLTTSDYSVLRTRSNVELLVPVYTYSHQGFCTFTHDDSITNRDDILLIYMHMHVND